MRDAKQIRKVLYVGASNIALIVINNVDNNNDILFASQVEVDSSNLQPKISQLLTDAANFLGFNIKDVELVFDDSQITKYSYTNREFVDCNSEEDIAKEIFKEAKINNYFVNEINFFGVKFDEIDKVATVNCQICASDYITYKKYIKAVSACNIVITNTNNLYKLLKQNKENIELTIKIENGAAIVCEYYGNKLNNVIVVDLKMNDIKQHIADKFSVSLDKVGSVLAIANQLAVAGQLDELVINNYNLKTKTYNEVKAMDLLALYRDEVKVQINNYVDFRNFQNVVVVSDLAINQLEDFNFITNDEIGFENISVDKFLCLQNIDLNKEINQFNFENKIKSFDLVVRS